MGEAIPRECGSVPICPCEVTEAAGVLGTAGALCSAEVSPSELNGLSSQGMKGRAGAKTDGTKASAGGPQVWLPRRNTARESFRDTHTLFKHIAVFHLQVRSESG